MMEEREMDEMRRLQGRDPGKEKLAWMYAPVGIQNDADDYLMGKPKETVKNRAWAYEFSSFGNSAHNRNRKTKNWKN